MNNEEKELRVQRDLIIEKISELQIEMNELRNDANKLSQKINKIKDNKNGDTSTNR